MRWGPARDAASARYVFMSVPPSRVACSKGDQRGGRRAGPWRFALNGTPRPLVSRSGGLPEERPVSWLAGRCGHRPSRGGDPSGISDARSPLTVAGAADDWAPCLGSPSRHSQFHPRCFAPCMGNLSCPRVWRAKAKAVKRVFDIIGGFCGLLGRKGFNILWIIAGFAPYRGFCVDSAPAGALRYRAKPESAGTGRSPDGKTGACSSPGSD